MLCLKPALPIYKVHVCMLADTLNVLSVSQVQRCTEFVIYLRCLVVILIVSFVNEIALAQLQQIHSAT